MHLMNYLFVFISSPSSPISVWLVSIFNLEWGITFNYTVPSSNIHLLCSVHSTHEPTCARPVCTHKKRLISVWNFLSRVECNKNRGEQYKKVEKEEEEETTKLTDILFDEYIIRRMRQSWTHHSVWVCDKKAQTGEILYRDGSGSRSFVFDSVSCG